MKKTIVSCITFFAYTYVNAQEAYQESLDQRINDGFKNATDWFVDAIFEEIPITSEVGIPWVLVVLLLGASYFTIYFKGINIRSFLTSIRIVRGKYDDLEESDTLEVSENVHTTEGDLPDTIRIEGGDGEVSHFQALTAALSATVGLGNVAGVAIALSIGGPGATFWMILVGFLGMASKFVECTLGVAYREIDEHGTVYGGPMYYLSKGLKERGFGGLGKVLAIIFAIMCVGGSFGGGNMFQANQAFKLFEHVTGAENSFIHEKGWLFGLIMAIFVAIVIIGGIKKIAKVTDKIVPSMVVVYVVAVITVITINYKIIPEAILAIVDGAFSAEGISGGIVGVMIQGFRRAAFSNEAGIGSASIAHAAVKTKYAASEGLVALLEPFIDTVVICTMTAMVLIITGQIEVGAQISDEQGVLLTASALESGISWFPYVLSVAVILFAFSSMISWSYYGYQAWSYLFGREKYVAYIYKTIFCICVIIGSAASLTAVTDFSDAMIFSMLVPNMIGLFIMAPRVAKELKKYREAISKNTFL
ncbi:alanine/glycine:cation symporter family protein [Aquimarina sp. 2201CG14-23]|uniref:alanine/glycine:cation symporter family protein n=1 Tax=Aquimarina mycalae TaxID=3040073 RepID=UPI0024781A91|nr:alanine/glycine:cation symporter family protein [Aquimarina sp. 2201CG14-23]MDH7444498.1 alanine/glycine:cation symporter family protein [Aquimarina sp. 2201CG14-23]